MPHVVCHVDVCISAWFLYSQQRRCCCCTDDSVSCPVAPSGCRGFFSFSLSLLRSVYLPLVSPAILSESEPVIFSGLADILRRHSRCASSSVSPDSRCLSPSHFLPHRFPPPHGVSLPLFHPVSLLVADSSAPQEH